MTKPGGPYLYEINGKDLLVDYGVYFRAKSEFITQEAAHGDGSPVTVAEVEYLREYYGEDAPETVSLREAEHILERTRSTASVCSTTGRRSPPPKPS